MALLMFTTAPVSAQAWLQDRGSTQGAGIRAGNLEIHPGVASEIGYDSNVFLADPNKNPNQPSDQLPVGSAILRVTPHLFLSTLGAQRTEDDGGTGAPPTVQFRGGAAVPVYQYFGANKNAGAEANVDFALRLLPQRVVSFGATGSYNRTIRPFTTAATTAKYGRNVLDVGPEIRFQTAGGVLKAGLGGNFNYTFFDDALFAVYDNKTYRAVANASWTFLPKTALVYDASMERRNMASGAVAGIGSGPLRVDSNLYQFRLGINGALTARLSGTFMVGYAAMFFQAPGRGGADTDNVNVLAQLTWLVSETGKLVLGFDRTTTAAYQGNYQLNNRVSLAGNVMVAGALMLSARGSVSAVGYGADIGVDNKARKDLRVGVDVNAEYRLANWIALLANAGVLSNISNSNFVSGVGATQILDPVRFTRFEAFLGLRIFY
jgi:hypothetical protein